MTMTTPVPHWPDVPACYGWLSLDARGNWRLKEERIAHPGLIAFLNAHYAHDAEGNWLVNNGPQRVYVRLERAPLVLRLQPDGRLSSHTGRAVTPRAPVCIDEEGCVVLATDAGPGVVDDRDLASFVAELRDAQGQPASDETLLATLTGTAVEALFWRGHRLVACPRSALAARFGFQLDPQAADAAAGPRSSA